MNWKILAHLPNYEISEFGDIRRITASKTRKIGSKPKGMFTRMGYKRYNLTYLGGGKRTFLAHILVCEAWHGAKPSEKHQVAHNDGNPGNNHYSNLRWATSKENQGDRKLHNTDAVGIRNGRAKLNDTLVKEIRNQFTGKHGEVRKLSRKYNLAWSAMNDLLKRKHWKHIS